MFPVSLPVRCDCVSFFQHRLQPSLLPACLAPVMRLMHEESFNLEFSIQLPLQLAPNKKFFYMEIHGYANLAGLG